MKPIYQSAIFNLIAKSNHTEISNEDFAAALDAFAAELSIEIDATIDYALAFRTLSSVCVKLHTLHRGELPPCEAGKKRGNDTELHRCSVGGGKFRKATAARQARLSQKFHQTIR